MGLCVRGHVLVCFNFLVDVAIVVVVVAVVIV